MKIIHFIVGTCVLLSSSITTSIDSSAQTHIIQLASGFIIARAIHVAAELKIADYLVDGPQHITNIAQKTNLNQDALLRLMRLLASYTIFNHDENDYFSLTPLAQELVSTNPHSLWPWLTYHNGIDRWAAYGDMKYTIETGNPAFNHLFGKSFFDVLTDNPLQAIQFDAGMQNLSAQENTRIAYSYDFSSYEHIMDIGGGKGGLLAEIMLKENTPLRNNATLFDLPYVQPSAQEHLTHLKLEKNITFIPSTGFFEIPKNNDLYILKRILHDWNDEECLTILKNCYHAMNKENSRLLIIETIVLPENTRDFNKDIDLAMMILFGGKERTTKEWQTLLQDADLEIVNIHPTDTMLSIIEVQKSNRKE